MVTHHGIGALEPLAYPVYAPEDICFRCFLVTVHSPAEEVNGYLDLWRKRLLNPQTLSAIFQ